MKIFTLLLRKTNNNRQLPRFRLKRSSLKNRIRVIMSCLAISMFKMIVTSSLLLNKRTTLVLNKLQKLLKNNNKFSKKVIKVSNNLSNLLLQFKIKFLLKIM
jgi:hypothetical protein